MIWVVDEPPGSGKTTAVISYMNQHPDKRYVYISPLLDEDDRIHDACPSLHFVRPKAIIESGKNRPSKMFHIKKLINKGLNIATTHKAFDMFTPELVEMIQEKEYTLIMDETVNVMESDVYFYEDVKMLEKAGSIEPDNGMYHYTGEMSILEGRSHFSDICRLAYSKNLYMFEDIDSAMKGNELGRYYYFTMPIDLILSFKETFILTYLFESSELYLLFRMHNVEYDRMGISKNGGSYTLSEDGVYHSELINNIKNLIDIYEDDVYVPQGRGRPKVPFNTYWGKRGSRSVQKDFGLTKTFYENKKNKDIIALVRNNQKRYFDKMVAEYGGDKKYNCMWTVYKQFVKKLKSPKIQNCWVPLNCRATNKWSDRTIVSWLVDIHAQPEKLLYFRKYGNGFTLDEDLTCLSTMIQFVFRSAIRRGEHISIYIPSKRSRDIFTDWVNDPEKYHNISHSDI